MCLYNLGTYQRIVNSADIHILAQCKRNNYNEENRGGITFIEKVKLFKIRPMFHYLLASQTRKITSFFLQQEDNTVTI